MFSFFCYNVCNCHAIVKQKATRGCQLLKIMIVTSGCKLKGEKKSLFILRFYALSFFPKAIIVAKM